MKKTIWKFELNVADTQTVRMPKDSEILCVQTQFERPCILALVNPEPEDVEERTIETFGTGSHVYSDIARNYIGTYQLERGALVFHVFERIS